MKRNGSTAAVLFPAASLARNALLALAGSVFLALMAQISVPTLPVPITGQTFGILLLGAAYGSRLATATVLLYVLEGAVGLPVFANGQAGFAVLAGPTGGYLLGFVLAAWLVGRLAERGWDRNIGLTTVAMLLGNAVLYVPGLLWLGILLAPDLPTTLQWGLLPFLPGDVLKLVLAACVACTARAAAERWRGSGRS